MEKKTYVLEHEYDESHDDIFEVFGSDREALARVITDSYIDEINEFSEKTKHMSIPDAMSEAENTTSVTVDFMKMIETGVLTGNDVMALAASGYGKIVEAQSKKILLARLAKKSAQNSGKDMFDDAMPEEMRYMIGRLED